MSVFVALLVLLEITVSEIVMVDSPEFVVKIDTFYDLAFSKLTPRSFFTVLTCKRNRCE